MVTGLEITNKETTDTDEHYIPCLKGKTTCNIIPKKSDVENPKRLHKVFLDVYGPFDVERYSWYRYFVTLIDGYSHYVRVKPIRTKDKASGILTEWITCLETETREKVNFLRTNGREKYMGEKFQKWLKSKRIHYEFMNPNTLQENSMAKWLNQTILEMIRSMMFDTKLPKSFWTFFVNYSQEILNRLPTRALTKKMTLFKALYKRKPLVAYMQIFGCPVYVHVPDAKQEKLNAKAISGLFVGLSQNRKTYIVADSQNLSKVYIFHNVTFLERPEEPEQERIQVVNEVLQQEQHIVPDETKKPESKGMVESLNLVQEDGNKEKSENTEKRTQDNTPGEPWHSKQIRCPPIQDDNSCYSISSYSHQKCQKI